MRYPRIDRGRDPFPGGEALSLLILLAGAIIVRALPAGIGYGGDEIFSVRLADAPFATMLAGALGDQPHPPLHYLYLWGWIHAFGPGEMSVRVSSIVLAAGFLLSAYVLFRRFLGVLAALAALAVLSFSPYFYFFTLEARPYVIIALFGALNLNSFFSLSDKPESVRRLVLWSASVLAVLFAQYLSIVVLALEGLFLLARAPRRVLRFLVAGAVPVGLAGAWFAASFLQHGRLLPQINWIGPPRPFELIWFFVASIGADTGLPSIVLLALLCLPALSFAWARLAARRLPGHEVFLALVAFGIPLLVFTISVLGPKPVFAPRQLLVPALCFVLLIGIAVQTLPRGAAATVAAALVLWSAVALGREPPSTMFGPWRELAARVDRIAGPAPLLTVEATTALYLGFYRRTGAAKPIQSAAALRSATPLFVACRPFKCAELQDRRLAGRRRLLGDWRWGAADTNQATRELRLYRLLPAKS